MSATDQAEFSRLQLNVNRLNMKEGGSSGGGDCGEERECAFAGRDHIQSIERERPQ